MKRETISIVTPVYNEEGCLAEFNERLHNALREVSDDFEIVYVNDGSTDNSLSEILSFHEKDNRVKVICLSRNFGQQQALNAGLDNANGEFIVFMDSDLQDKPEDIVLFFRKILEGYDVVYAIRTERKESFLKVFLSRLFYRILSKSSAIPLPLDSGVFSMMRRCVLVELTKMPERNKYLAGLRAFVGFRQVGIPLSRDVRHHEVARNNFLKLSKLAFDAIFSFSYIPLRVGTIVGLIGSVVAFCWLVFISAIRILSYFKINIIPENFVVRGLPTILAFQVIFGSMILICLGIVGEYVGRIYDEVKQRPYYIIKEKIGNFRSDKG